MIRAFVLSLVYVALVATASVAWPQNLKPAEIPKELIHEAWGAPINYRGQCPRPEGMTNCAIGEHPTNHTVWILYFDGNGVIWEVVTIKDGKTEVRWTHPNMKT